MGNVADVKMIKTAAAVITAWWMFWHKIPVLSILTININLHRNQNAFVWNFKASTYIARCILTFFNINIIFAYHFWQDMYKSMENWSDTLKDHYKDRAELEICLNTMEKYLNPLGISDSLQGLHIVLSYFDFKPRANILQEWSISRPIIIPTWGIHRYQS